jgi:hypothetical protein
MRKNPVILDAMHKAPLFYPEVILRARILQKCSRCWSTRARVSGQEGRSLRPKLLQRRSLRPETKVSGPTSGWSLSHPTHVPSRDQATDWSPWGPESPASASQPRESGQKHKVSGPTPGGRLSHPTQWPARGETPGRSLRATAAGVSALDVATEAFRGDPLHHYHLREAPYKTTDEGMTPRVLDIGLPATAQEQDEHSKPKKPKTS